MSIIDRCENKYSYPNYKYDIEKKIIAAILNNILCKGNIRLDFNENDSLIIGDGQGKLVGFCPPRLHDLIWILLRPTLHFGESYTKGCWHITEGELADIIFYFLNSTSIYAKIFNKIIKSRGVVFYVKQVLLPEYLRKKCAHHYDIDYELYEKMLDSKGQYTCAFYSDECDTLDKAQQNKINTIIERLDINSNLSSILEIGFGWGGLAQEIVTNFDISYTGISISSEQCRIATHNKNKLPHTISDRLEYICIDYSEFTAKNSQKYDRIVSVGMFEHVGYGKQLNYFICVKQLLEVNGKALVHCVIRPEKGRNNTWIDKYIFPNSFVPTLSEMISQIEKSGLDLMHIYIHAPYNYNKTLHHWRENFLKSWPSIKNNKYNGAFCRMWEFYLAGMENTFDDRQNNFKIVQVVVRRRF